MGSVICFFVFSSSIVLSGGKKRSYESTKLGAMESNLTGDVAEGQQSSASAGAPQRPVCRPWDRGDFMKRLATFKSISWFAKPKVVSSCPQLTLYYCVVPFNFFLLLAYCVRCSF